VSFSDSHATDERAFERLVKRLVFVLFAMACGLGLAATGASTLGGVLILGSWGGAVVTLHRLGRVGAILAAPRV
jgi:hypothetical protein